MMFPLVREMAVDGVPVTVTCRVLDLCRQQYYRWLDQPFTDAELDEAWLTNAIFDAHRDDPEFGYRFLADEVRQAGFDVSDRTVWRICRDMGWWSVFGKPKRGKGSKPGTPAHDDLVRRNFTADAPNQVWVADLTEHWTLEGKLYCCAIKDLYSNRIVGWSLDSRMKARLVVAAVEMAVARRKGDVAGCIVHSGRGSQFRARKVQRSLTRHGLVGSMGQVGAAGDNAAMESFFALLQNNVLDRRRWAHPRRSQDRDRHLDRTHLPPTPTTSRARPIDPDRIRSDHDPSDGNRRLTQPVTPKRGSPISVAIRCFQNAFITNNSSGTCRAVGGPSAFRYFDTVDGCNPISAAISLHVHPWRCSS